MMGVGLPAEWDVVVPHVEVRPVDANEEHKAAKRRMTTGPWKNEANADGDLHHARDEYPNGGVAQHGRNNGFEPGGVGEMLDADVDIHPPKDNGGDGQDQGSHGSPSRHEQVKFCLTIDHIPRDGKSFYHFMN